MYGLTNSVNSSGGLSPDAAVLHVRAPIGSTVSISKNNIVAKTIGPGRAHGNADGKNADYYFPIKSANYGAWVVTSTDGVWTRSIPVTISANQYYYIKIEYMLYLFRNGDQCTDVTGGWKAMGSSTTKILDDSIVLIGSSQGGNQSVFTNSKVNPGGRTILKVKFVPANPANGGTYYMLHAGSSNQNTSVGTGGMVVNYVENYNGHYNEERTYSIDISNYKNSDYFIQFNMYLEKATIYEVWMEW